MSESRGWRDSGTTFRTPSGDSNSTWRRREAEPVWPEGRQTSRRRRGERHCVITGYYLYFNVCFQCRETKKLLEDYKFRISKSDQEIATLEANVQRLESQVVRYKKASETSELNEENLKSDRRKMQRELRDAQTRNEELETQNKHLQARLDKLKTAKSNLLKEL